MTAPSTITVVIWMVVEDIIVIDSVPFWGRLICAEFPGR